MDQSLLRQKTDDGESRFGMLETIREYGRDRSKAAGGADQIGHRHLRYFRVPRANGRAPGSDRARWLDRFERATTTSGSRSSAPSMTTTSTTVCSSRPPLWRFWYQRGYLREGRAWLQLLLAMQPGAAPSGDGQGIRSPGGLAYWLSDAVTAQASYEAAARLARELGDRDAEAGALYNLAFRPGHAARPRRSRAAFQ